MELYCAVLYCTVLYCTVLYCTLYCTVLYCAVLCCAVLYCTVPCTVLYPSLYCAVLCCTVLCCTALYCTLYCTVLFTVCAALVDGSLLILYCLGLDDFSTLSCMSVLNYSVSPCPVCMSCTACTVRVYWFANQIDFSDCSDTSHLSFDDGNYSLLQMHIHSPSEHMVSDCSCQHMVRGVEYYRCMYCRIRVQ